MTSEHDEGTTPEKEEGGLTLTDHLEELRGRLIKCILGLLAGFLACYGFSEQLLAFVAQPLAGAMPEGSSLTMIKVTEGFLTHLKISLLAGVFLSSPLWFYQLWKFVAPGLYPKERKYVWPFVGAATVFFLMGASFCYLLVMPWGLEFLLAYGRSTGGPVEMSATLSVGEYLGFFTRMCLAFGLVFELPVVVFFLARMGLVTHKTLSAKRGIAMVCIFILAAFLTPPDVFTQVLMAAPLLLLYELSIIVARVFGTAPVEEEDDEDDEDEDEDE